MPILDGIIGLWSLYAFFMVVGLSGDVIGKNIANVFREASTVFLQYSYFLLVLFLFPAGFVAYAERFVLMLFLIILLLAVGFVLYRKDKPSSIRKKSKASAEKKSWNLKKHIPFIVGFIFLLSTYAMLNYPKTGVAPFDSTVIAYIVCAVSVTILLFLRKQKENDNDTYTSDDDYYCWVL